MHLLLTTLRSFASWYSEVESFTVQVATNRFSQSIFKPVETDDNTEGRFEGSTFSVDELEAVDSSTPSNKTHIHPLYTKVLISFQLHSQRIHLGIPMPIKGMISCTHTHTDRHEEWMYCCCVYSGRGGCDWCGVVCMVWCLALSCLAQDTSVLWFARAVVVVNNRLVVSYVPPRFGGRGEQRVAPSALTFLLSWLNFL